MNAVARLRLVSSVAVLLVGLPVAALADGGGGGSAGSGGGEFSSSSGPQYNPAQEYQKGVAALDAKNFKEASKFFGHVLIVQPRDANSNYLLGLSLAGQGNDKKALGAFQKAAKYNDGLIPAHQQLGVTKARLGDSAGAALVRDGLAAKLAACGATCANAGEYKAAIAAIDAAITAGPQARVESMVPSSFKRLKGADQAYLTAVSLINEQRYAAAIASLDAAAQAVGPHPDVLTYLGFANRKLGKFDLAEGYYRAALSIAPQHRGALEYYGELKVERGDMAGARRNLALLDRSCAFGCYQAEELRRWIIVGHSPEA